MQLSKLLHHFEYETHILCIYGIQINVDSFWIYGRNHMEVQRLFIYTHTNI